MCIHQFCRLMRLLAHDSLVQDIDIVALCTTIRFQAAYTVLLRKLGHCTGIMHMCSAVAVVACMGVCDGAGLVG